MPNQRQRVDQGSPRDSGGTREPACDSVGAPPLVPTLSEWPRVPDYANWLGTSNVPKLFFKAEPGAILNNDRLLSLVRGWPALTEKTVAGVHFVQEDSPDEIGKAIADWMRTLA